MVLKKLVAVAAFAVISSVTCLPLFAQKTPPPPAVQATGEDEEDNFHGRVPFIPDTDPVFAGRLQGIKDMAQAIRRGYAQKPMVRAYERLYPRLYPFDHPFETRPAYPVAAKGRPESVPAWSFLGPTNIPGRITALVRHPSDPNTLYVGGADGGVWKTTDAGTTWTPLTDFKQTLSIGSLALNPQNPNEVWAGAGEGNFAIDNYPGSVLYHTTDAGASWTTIPHAMGDVRALAVRPDAPSTLFAAANVGIFRSTDSGATWTQLTNGIPAGVGSEVLLDPSAPTTVYAALGRIFGDSNNGIYKSTDGGTTFTKLATGLPTASVGRISLALAPSQTSTLYAAIQSTADYNLLGAYKSTDGGGTWSTLNGAPGFCSSQCWYDLEVAVDPANAGTVYLGGIDIFKSTNGGGSFTSVSSWSLDQSSTKYVHADQHALVATGPGQLWAGCDGGVSYTANGGTTWSFRGKNLNTTQYYNIAMHPTKASWTLGGTQDNGTHLASGAATFERVYGGDGGYCAISPADPNTMYEEYVYLDMNKSTDGGARWTSCSAGINTSDPVQFIAPFVMDPSNPSVLYAGTNRIYRTSDGASSWTPISSTVTAGKVAAIGVGPSTGGVVFSGGTRGEIYRTDDPADASPTWIYAGSGLPNRSVTSIAVAPDEQTVYATLSGTGTAHIWKSTNRGSTWTALSLANGLPDEPFDSIVIHPADSQTLYAGSDFGVYASFDGGATWSTYGAGLPRVAVDSLQISAQQGLLQAGTHGRGLWQTVALSSGVLSVTPAATPSSGGAPLTVSFGATAVGGTSPYTYAWTFGDGDSGSGATPSHTYPNLGNYTATVTVTDAASAHVSGSVQISVVVPPPVISSVAAVANPLRLKVMGSNFESGATVKIDGTAVPTTVYKSSTQLVAKGSTLKTLVPKGRQVSVTVSNPDGGESVGYTYSR
jgi:photosystem II stability/assembly factor-like uncharacterized protein